MIILSILLFILKVIGIILAVLLLAVVFLLFSKLHYSADAVYNGNLSVKAGVKWLLCLLRVDFVYSDGETDMTVKLLWFDLSGKSKKKPDEKEESKEAEKAEDKKKKKKDENSKAGKEEQPTEKKPLTERVGSLFERIEKFKERYDPKVLMEHTLRLISRLFKGLGFRKFRLNCEFGFSDPYTTGKLLGYYWIVKGMTKMKANVIPNFENEILKLDTGFKGKTSLWRLLYPLGVFITRKPVWRLYRDSRNKGRNKNKNK